jgi:predicted deacylase
LELRDGTIVNLPVILVNGTREGPTVVLNGATHPVELAGIGVTQVVTRKRLDPSKLSGGVIAFPITNPLGYQFGEYISPHDALNMMVAYLEARRGA